MNKWLWVLLFVVVGLVLLANGSLLWPFEAIFGLLAGLIALVIGIAIALISVPLALMAVAVAVLGLLLLAAVVTVLALLPVLLPIALVVGFIWLLVRVSSSSSSTAATCIEPAVEKMPGMSIATS